jgi:hypothetical protein
MSAPGSVKLNKNVLLGIKCNLVKVGGDQNLNWSLVPIFGQFLAQKMLL